MREASRRTVRMRHFDVQLLGGMILHQGKIAEMKTGEGKTLVATLPSYLNALMGRGVHVVTVNDYLARRDAEWMGPIYQFLGLTVGVIVHDLDDAERKAAYAADVTYGTNNEFGFDYLRDNMKFDLADCVQRKHWFAIVDEVDSILIDEARTPLIISGPSEESTDVYYRVDRIIPKLKRDVDFLVDEKAHTVTLTEVGIGKCEKLMGVDNLYDADRWSSCTTSTRPCGRTPLPARRGLHGQGRPGHHRGRIHRPADARPPLERRAAPGRGGQGRGQDRAGEPDPGHRHLPELLPHVPQAVRHDRHGRHRGGGVLQDLQARGHRGPHPHAHDPR